MAQPILTLEKIFSKEEVKDLFALFFRMSSLNLPPLVEFSGMVLFGTTWKKGKKKNSKVTVQTHSGFNEALNEGLGVSC